MLFVLIPLKAGLRQLPAEKGISPKAYLSYERVPFDRNIFMETTITCYCLLFGKSVP